jgi:alanyl-tRNA synthetase
LIVQGDPTLLFTNAGMNPFKDLFLGNRTPDFRRVADTQPCLRVSGKHNDLEDVGKDTYHHTLFEMLGNWSFGDYFKEEAIAWAWELLTGPYGLSADRLYVTYFEGDATDGLEADHQARNFWKQWIAEDRILPGNKKDNFWEMGDTGPCGPCSEIHMDLRSEEERKALDARELVNKDHPQVIELWNLVFMEFQRMADGRLQALPARHVDTGMGFERLCRAVAGASSNYDTDVFVPLIRQIEASSGHRYGAGNEAVDIAMRVVADHTEGITLSDAARTVDLAPSTALRHLRALEATGVPAAAIEKSWIGNFTGELFVNQGHLGAAVAGAHPDLEQLDTPRHTITVDYPVFRRRLLAELGDDFLQRLPAA